MSQPVSYLNCPRCGLSVSNTPSWLAMVHCPRCIAVARTAVELFSSEIPASYGNESLPDHEHAEHSEDMAGPESGLEVSVITWPR